MPMLHVDVIGSGEPLVLLHGWGMHGGVWGDAAQKLAADFQVHCLPGTARANDPSPVEAGDGDYPLSLRGRVGEGERMGGK
jgi:pimeloyl-ACP methyl ester carboxylesterase